MLIVAVKPTKMIFQRANLLLSPRPESALNENMVGCLESGDPQSLGNFR